MADSLSAYSSPNQFLKHQDSLFWLACSRLQDGRVGKIEKALTRKKNHPLSPEHMLMCLLYPLSESQEQATILIA